MIPKKADEKTKEKPESICILANNPLVENMY